MSAVSKDTRFDRAISFARRKHRQVDRVFKRVSRCDRDAFAACWSEPELQVVMQQLCSGIICLDQVLSKQECESVITGSRNRLSPSSMLDGDRLTVSSHRTSTGVSLADHELPRICGKVRQLLHRITRLPIVNQEEIKVVNYTRGQEYKVHHDCHKFARRSENGRFLESGGHRKFSCLIYLNEVVSGGCTLFPRLNLSIMPRPGRLVIWNNLDAGFIKSEMVHCSEPVIAGEKWVITCWVREHEYRDEPLS